MFYFIYICPDYGELHALTQVTRSYELLQTVIIIQVSPPPLYTGLHSKYPAGLDSEPELADLMNEVAAAIPVRWRDIGLQLGLKKSVLDGLGQVDTNHYYSNVFELWRNQNSAQYPYTWQTLLHTLNTPAVGERKLENDIRNKLTGCQT